MKINVNKKAVGSRIKQIRTSKGYTLESFGKLFGASKSNVQKWETGFTLPNKERLASISKIADMTVNELLYGSTYEFINNNFDNLLSDKNKKIIDEIIDKYMNYMTNSFQSEELKKTDTGKALLEFVKETEHIKWNMSKELLEFVRKTKNKQ